MDKPFRQAGVVVTFRAVWKRGRAPLRISVLVERVWSGYLESKGVDPFTGIWSADVIARRFVRRACMLLKCEPRDLLIRAHPADGFIYRSV